MLIISYLWLIQQKSNDADFIEIRKDRKLMYLTF